jgi:E1-E2 ATPase
VEFGQSAVDRAVMTGEPVPTDVAEGDAVTAGTVVVTGRLVVRAVKVGSDTQLAHLVALVEQAQSQKAAVQRLADRVSGWGRCRRRPGSPRRPGWAHAGPSTAMTWSSAARACSASWG